MLREERNSDGGFVLTFKRPEFLTEVISGLPHRDVLHLYVEDADGCAERRLDKDEVEQLVGCLEHWLEKQK
jgi:hypothetical protein